MPWPSPRCWSLVSAGLLLLVFGFAAPSRSFAADDVKDAKEVSKTAAAGHSNSNAESHPSAAGHEKPAVIKPELNLGVYSLIVFVALFLILRKYAWDPIARALDQREQNLQQAYDEAEKTRAEAKQVQEQYQQKMRDAADEVKTLVEEARRDATATKADMLKTANEEAGAIKTRAESAISLAKDEALKDLWERSAHLAVSVAGKVLSRELSRDDHNRLIEQALREMSALKEATA